MRFAVNAVARVRFRLSLSRIVLFTVRCAGRSGSLVLNKVLKVLGVVGRVLSVAGRRLRVRFVVSLGKVF